MEKSSFHIRDGFAQSDRFFRELSEDYFRIADENLSRLVDRMNLFARTQRQPFPNVFEKKTLPVVCSILATEANIAGTGDEAKSVLILFSRFLWWKKELKIRYDAAGDSLLRLLSEGIDSFYTRYHSGLRKVKNDKNSTLWIHAYSALSSSLVSLQKEAEMIFPELMTSGENEPALSLYVAVMKLFVQQQRRLNEFPDKRTSFYYKEILGEMPKKETGDFAYLVFPSVVPGSSLELPKGTRFGAGKNEDGDNIVFETQKVVNINDAKVARLLTLSVLDDIPLQWTEVPVYDLAKFPFKEEQTPYPLFGMTRSGIKVIGAKNARIGFAFASRVLAMNGGSRKISLKLFFEPESIKESPLDRSAKANEFIRSFCNAFQIYLSTECGWFCIGGYQLESRALNAEFPEACLGLTFSIPNEAPAICAYSPKVHGDNWNTDFPVLKMEINPEVQPSPWAVLRKFALRKVLIETHVLECKNLVLNNELGPLSPSTPFQPFGPIPSRGSSFLVGCPEILGKQLSNFRINAKWCGLPENLPDISFLYRGYPKAPCTKDFIVSIQSLVGGRWLPLQEEAVISEPLFELRNHQLNTSLSISCKNAIRSSNAYDNGGDGTLEYSPDCKQGFFKLTLISPEGAFQHQAYSQALSDSLIMRSTKKLLKSDADIPRSPYIPTLENISVNYQAHSEIRAKRSADGPGVEKIIYLHPFGFDSAKPLSQTGGSLFVGLTFESLPKSVSLYFHLSRDSAPMFNSNTGEFAWSYLGANGWVALSSQNVLDDTTAGFTASGVVTIALPPKIAKEQNLMPSGFYWLRLTPGKEWKQCCRLFSVYAQGVGAVRVSGFGCHSSFSCCKAGSIKEILNAPAGLSSVCQLADSFGGEPEESELEMRTRVAERLYHHNRALTARDYERLILEEFPEILKVKCFPGMDPKNPASPSPGHLLIVPVSPLFKDGRFQWNPRLSGKVLHDIQKFAESRASRSVKISVANPYFEKIQVRCVVTIRSGFQEGEKLKELNTALNHYISPWYNPGPTEHFGWCLKEANLRAFVQNMDFVQTVDAFSVLRVAPQDRFTFQMDNMDEKSGDGVFYGLCPWSIAVPIRTHYINIASESGGRKSVAPGYGDLEIGSTFIIQAK
ncbi:MAG: baseplate J/gp47 family protein [Fibrobacteraceae bacterium]